MGKLRIILDFKNGPAVPDLKAKDYVYERLNEFDGSRDMELILGTELMFEEVRLALITDKAEIRPMIELYSHDILLQLNEYGSVSDWEEVDCRFDDLLDLIIEFKISTPTWADKHNGEME